jgi:hypothetical protein
LREKPALDLGEHRQGFEPECARMVVRPHRCVAELGAALGQRRRDLVVEPGGHPETPLRSLGHR